LSIFACFFAPRRRYNTGVGARHVFAKGTSKNGVSFAQPLSRAFETPETAEMLGKPV
jgi:hypothetical protein